MSKYTDLLQEMTKKVNDAGSSRHSKADYVEVTRTLLNSPEHEVPVYVNDGDPVITKPAQRYRNSLKPMLEKFGVDKAETDKLDTYEFSKEHADALNDVALQSIKDYTATGRKLVLPVTSPTEAQFELSQVDVDKKVTDTKKPVQGEDGTYTLVPTGERKTTEAHKELRASNKVPGWLWNKEKI